MELIFASTNTHKTEEIRAMLGPKITIKNLADLNFTEDIAETADTFSGNASIKSHYIADKFHENCFGDDSGLEIDALNGEPGVNSAHYSGSRDFDENMDLVLRKMEGVENRKARFKTVISLILNGEEHFFEGSVEGTILKNKSGSKGFGYDPIFQPDGYEISFAEMSLEEKNRISHRAMALGKMVDFINLSIS